MQNSAALTSPRWNQKVTFCFFGHFSRSTETASAPSHLTSIFDTTDLQFSSLVPRKKPKAEKGQRVRGPAIQWTAETLFGTADEAKGYITRDAKWKFRYSHQTTEGKKVNLKN